jgi:V-type H+-transporting ATPase subunit E
VNNNNATNSAGGLKLTAARGRIVCDNTLDSRLQVAFQNLMPTIRSNLFGAKV